MTENKIQAVCDECGKSYRVPSAERTYTCKACGGTVGVADDASPAPKRVRRSAVKPREDGDENAERPARRRHAARSSNSGMRILMVLLVVSGVAFGLFKSGLIAQAAGAEKDLGQVTASFKGDWEAADLGDLADWYHPDKRAEFRVTLDKMAANRGWEDGFPAIVQKSERVIEGTQEEPVKGMSLLVWGAEQESVTVMWQYEPARTRWYAYDVTVTPPRLAPRVAAFREAWAKSDTTALEPFFRADAAEKMAGLVARKAEEGGWARNYPSLGEPEIHGEDQARNPMAKVLGGSRPESVFPVDGGELVVRWSFRNKDDFWAVTGFKFP